MSKWDVVSQQKEAIQEKIEKMKAGLPHLYEQKWYAWSWAFFKSMNRMNILTAANQIGKSSCQIRKCIEWAGNPKLWPELWPNSTPRMFWYFYPDGATVKQEVENKWIPEFLPRGEYKDHPTYGWEIIYGEKRAIDGIRFNSGITVYFKAYAQNISNLQSGTLSAIFTDEELPEAFYSELSARLFASDGYFHMVFTATLGQDIWKRAMEGKGDSELFPDAHKQQISMYDCQFYMDGTPGMYSLDKIKRIEASCKSEAERLKRVMGKFVLLEGLKYYGFDATKNYCKPFEIPSSYHLYAGVDIGSGGTAHPPAIAFIAVRPDFRRAYVFKGWRGDDGQTYTAGDVLSKFIELRGDLKFIEQRFDWGSKDFGTMAQRASEPFLGAEKSHELGEDRLNTLFKNMALYIFDEPELQKLGGELSSLLKSTAKNKAKDDLIDAVRYGVVSIPWDWSMLTGELTSEERKANGKKIEDQKPDLDRELETRRGRGQVREEPEGWQELEDEFEFWNEF